MVKSVFRFLLKGGLIALWMVACYYICRRDGKIDYLLYWVVCGFPFGIGKMIMVLPPKKYGISGGLAMLVLEAAIGGVIGGACLLVKIVKLPVELFKK